MVYVCLSFNVSAKDKVQFYVNIMDNKVVWVWTETHMNKLNAAVVIAALLRGRNLLAPGGRPSSLPGQVGGGKYDVSIPSADTQ